MTNAHVLTQKDGNTASDNLKEAPSEQPLSIQNLYRDLFLHMNDGFAYCQVELDSQGKPVDYVFQDLNKAFRNFIGLQNKRIIGKKASELVSYLKPEFFDWLKVCTNVALTGRSLTLERPTQGKWYSISAFCPKKGYFAITVKDVTVRRKTDRALKQSEKQYKKLANSITDPFFAVDASLKVNYWNKASQKFTNLKAEEVLGKHFFEVFGDDKTTRKHVRIFQGVMKAKKPRTITGPLPKTGESVFEIRIYPTGNGISVLAKDITERRKLQAEMEQYTKHLEELVKSRTEKLKNVERLAAIGETAGMVGHDIRNPLQSIIGELYLAKDELATLPDGDPKLNLITGINSIEEQTLYINKIVTDLQDYAKQLVPTIQAIDLEENIQATTSALDIPKNVELTCYVDKPCPLFNTDASFLKRILLNLSRNGVQAMEEKGGQLSVNVFPREKSFIIAVTDTGPGIPNAIRENIFKPLFTTKSKGQGFGLAVVKKLVDALDGNISFETKMGKGTTFIMELPKK